MAILQGDMDADITMTDAKKLYSCIQHEELLLIKKRRWLIGCEESGSNNDPMKVIPQLYKEEFLLESFLRDNDISSQAMRTHLERSFKELICEEKGYSVIEENEQLLKMPKIQAHASPSVVSSANKILDRLDSMDNVALQAMDRKLRSSVAIPHIKLEKCSLSRKAMIDRLQKHCSSMMVKLSDGDELPRPLAKAMAVAALWFKLSRSAIDFPVPDFFSWPPEIKAVQNQLIKAILSFEKISKRRLKSLQPLMDPQTEVSMRAFRSSAKRLLINYLYEVGDVDFPESLSRALSLINRYCEGDTSICLSREIMGEELECMLHVSCQLKQVMWDILPDDNIDQEFTRIHMDGVESDDGSDSRGTEEGRDDMSLVGDACFGESGQVQVPSCHSDDESVGDSRPTTSALSSSPEKVGDSSLPVMASTELASGGCENLYIAIQDICDEASVLAHQLIGHLLEGFIQIEGVDLDEREQVLSYLKSGAFVPKKSLGVGENLNPTKDERGVLIQAVGELIPTFPKSGIKKIKKLMQM